MKKLVFCGCILTLLCGCIDNSPYWRLRYIPTTDEERRAVSEYIAKIISSSHSNDPEHLAARLYITGCELYCKPTMWEVSPGAGLMPNAYTGKWKYVETTD